MNNRPFAVVVGVILAAGIAGVLSVANVTVRDWVSFGACLGIVGWLLWRCEACGVGNNRSDRVDRSEGSYEQKGGA